MYTFDNVTLFTESIPNVLHSKNEWSWEGFCIPKTQPALCKTRCLNRTCITENNDNKRTNKRYMHAPEGEDKFSDIDTQESLLYTCVVPDEGSVSCTMLVEAIKWWVCCWCVLSIDCTEVAIAGAESLWEPCTDNGSTVDPFSSTILSIARLPRELCNIRNTVYNTNIYMFKREEHNVISHQKYNNYIDSQVHIWTTQMTQQNFWIGGAFD